MTNKLMRLWWFWGGITGVVSLPLLQAFLKKRFPVPPKIVVQHAKPGEELVALFGDSITEGEASSNYVDLQTERMRRESYRGGGRGYRL